MCVCVCGVCVGSDLVDREGAERSHHVSLIRFPGTLARWHKTDCLCVIKSHMECQWHIYDIRKRFLEGLTPNKTLIKGLIYTNVWHQSQSRQSVTSQKHTECLSVRLSVTSVTKRETVCSSILFGLTDSLSVTSLTWRKNGSTDITVMDW